MDPEKESCGISFTSKEKNEKIGQVSLCFVVGIISVLSIVPPKKGQNSAIKLWPYHIIGSWDLSAGLLIKR